MRKFKLKKNLTVFDYPLRSKDEIIEVVDNECLLNKNGIDLKLTLDDILNKPELFEEIIEDDFVVNIKEIDDSDLDDVKNYRIQLDVKTSKRKLMKIENSLREHIRNIISN